MREELLDYYDKELTYLYQMGAKFRERHGDVADRLMLEPTDCADPHVERLLQGVAFLAARVHLRLDDDFPELSEVLLRVVHPAFLRPIPSMTIVECKFDPGDNRTMGIDIRRGTALDSKLRKGGLSCQFRTGHAVELWPIKVTKAGWGQAERMDRLVSPSDPGRVVAAAASIHLSCLGEAKFSKMKILQREPSTGTSSADDLIPQDKQLMKLRFYLSGKAPMVYDLYELLANNCFEIQLRDPTKRETLISLNASNIRMVGFEADEALLPIDRRSIDGYRLLQEYFSLPEKFLFFDLLGLEALHEFETEAELVFLFSEFAIRDQRQQRLEQGIGAETFRLGCTPAINLFDKTADNISISQTKHEYKIVPDEKHESGMEIYEIERVYAKGLGKRVTLEPMYRYRYETKNRTVETKGRKNPPGTRNAFWIANRRNGQMGEQQPSEMMISVVDVDGVLTEPGGDSLQVETLCTNFQIPSKDLRFLNPRGDFTAKECPEAKFITALKNPTKTLQPPGGKKQIWPMISILSLNYLSLSQEGRKGLQEILRLHNWTDDSSKEMGILAIKSTPDFSLIESPIGLLPARGMLVQIQLDEQKFGTGGAFLFSAVLERFLAGYCSINSFTRVSVTTNLRTGEMVRWPARAGAQVLL